MRRRWTMVAAILGFFAWLSPAEGADLPAHQDLRERILSKIAAGEADSVRAIVRNARTDVPDVVQALLLQRDRDLAQGRTDSAAVRLERARTISLAYATALEDSSCLRMTEFREKLAEGGGSGAAGAATTTRVDELAVGVGLRESIEGGPSRPPSPRNPTDPATRTCCR